MSFNVEEFLQKKSVRYSLKGQKILIDSCASIAQAKNNDLSFCYYPDDIAIEHILKSGAGVILCNNSIRDSVDPKAWSAASIRFQSKTRICPNTK